MGKHCLELLDPAVALFKVETPHPTRKQLPYHEQTTSVTQDLLTTGRGINLADKGLDKHPLPRILATS